MAPDNRIATVKRGATLVRYDIEDLLFKIVAAMSRTIPTSNVAILR